MKKIGELACVTLLIQLIFLIPKVIANEPANPRKSVMQAIAEDDIQEVKVLRVANNPLLQRILPVLSDRAEGDRETAQRIASTLQKLEKNLILERTRGAKETAVYRMVAPAVVYVRTNESIGSGAVIDGKGYIITNWHTVASQPQVFVVFKPKDRTELTKELLFRATVEKVDQVTDLALLRISNPPKIFAPLTFGDVSTLAVGQDVYAIGHPKGEVWTFTKGIISQIRPNYAWSTQMGVSHRAKVIQTQTPINPGNSGGPLLDDSGRLIGINSFRGEGEGMNYAVAVDEVQAFLKREGSRESAPKRQEADLLCKESYDTMGRGWANIEGCYLAAGDPPPDLWLVYSVPRGSVTYGAFGKVAKHKINTVVISRDQQGEGLHYYIDTDCNGTVDLIGYQAEKSDKIDSYRLPSQPVRIVNLAKELDYALKAKKIPYAGLRVCQ